MNWVAGGLAFVILGLGLAIFLGGQWVSMCADRWGDRWYGFWLAMSGPLVLHAVAVAVALYAALMA